ncbi:hypothetical protein FB45DRAFT_1094626 [Roridomyces roridus]|uniref:Uncharacterized protein n=1 Tax=Roridomyces roridus TaxID=1738132 RepID=A0AAD7FFB1_9AGAR|nr:hypothetical protein FB45DRAFT_1094626 [Roridomyces roridus]
MSYARHPRYWEEETRSFVFAVQDTIYRFPVALLTMLSPPLSGIFSIPPPPPNQKAGPPEGTEENPVVIPGVTKKQVDDFLSYFLKAELPLAPIETLDPKRQEEVAHNLLTVGSLWEVQPARESGIKLFESLNLGPIRILGLAREFGLHEWIEKAVLQLIPMVGKLTVDDALALGALTLSILVQAQHQIQLERANIAYTAPTLRPRIQVPLGDCVDHKLCVRSVDQNWWLVVGRKILHPERPIELRDITTLLETTPFPGMSVRCQEHMVRGWKQNWIDEDSIKAAAVKGVTEFFRCLRM